MEIVDKGIYRTPSGSYQVRYRDPSGKQRAKHFDRLRDARNFRLENRLRMQRGDWIDPAWRSYPLRQWVEQVESRQLHLRRSTKAQYELLTRRYILPRFGDHGLGSITTEAVQAWIHELHAEGKSASTVNHAYTQLRALLGAAVDAGYLRRNPCQKVSRPPRNTEEMVFLTFAQLRSLASATGSYEPLILAAGMLGMRWGALAGLRWRNVGEREIRVVEQLTEVSGRLELGPLKTKESRRSLPLPSQIDLGPRGEHSVHVFTSPEGDLLRRSSFSRRVFKPALQRAGLPHMRFHDLRHTAAALQIEHGASEYELGRFLGHSRAETTRRYSHLFPAAHERTRDRLEGLS